ncbi:MAG: hypothetical protein A4E48_00819 [Methanosaeta sp. PtaU1.Bin060]|nr:MAG: hypothetical protein A4E48_00819 [Methanosaeta sp. PtaU1.Bin060]
MDNGQQILKCRDDKAPVILSKVIKAKDDMEPFTLADGCECSWLQKGNTLGTAKLRQRIEPWMTALFQSEHLALLVGSGLTHAVHHIATFAEKKSLPGMKAIDFDYFNKEINAEAKRSSDAAGRKEGNIEDQIRVANEVLRGVEIIADSFEGLRDKTNGLEEDLKRAMDDFASSILKGEAELMTANEKDLEKAFKYLVNFLMSFASRNGTRDRLQIFTTNYDRYIEAGAEVAGLHLLDRFIGSMAPIFRSSRLDIDMHYNPPGIRGEPRYLEGVARFTKLHGSIDWVSAQKSIRRIGLPFGVKSITPYLEVPGLVGVDAHQLMIYPNSAKDRETSAYPYVDLFRDFAAAVCRPNNTLISYGYSFGDEHINRVIEDMLTIPSTHLVVISYDDPLNRIMPMYDRLGRPAQISLLIGDHLGDLQALVDNYLPKTAIDQTTIRMAELLKSRGILGQTENDDEIIDMHETGEGSKA